MQTTTEPAQASTAWSRKLRDRAKYLASAASRVVAVIAWLVTADE